MTASLEAVRLAHLRAWRLSRGLTQARLARRAHVTRNTIITAEQGRPVWRSNAAKLARALAIEYAALLTASPAENEAEKHGHE